MFRVYHSNRLDLLKDLMVELIKRKPLPDPFAQEVMLVQSPGMAQWLQMELAQSFGIAANITFPLPATFIWQMFMLVLPEIPAKSAFNKAGMSWKLMSLLPDMLEKEAFQPLRHYLNDDSDRRKLFQLSSQVADLYDRYLVYRADWLNRWERGERVAELGNAQNWQADLWRELVGYTRLLGQPKWHRAGLYSHFITALEQADTAPPGLPGRVFICGISALPPVYLEALQALGRHIDIHLLFTNPCRAYWGDIQDYAFLARLQHRRRYEHASGRQRSLFHYPNRASSLFNEAGEQQLTNPLLASWGKLGRDNLYLLAQIDASDNDIDAFVEPETHNLLHTLQRDMLDLEDRIAPGLTEAQLNSSRDKRILDPEDDSLIVKVCHSPQREVEVLQDHLLALLGNDSDLQPRDIIVMVADIDSYAPFIQAVFAGASRERQLPFAISDRRASQAHPAIHAFLILLALPESRFAAGEVFSLLEVPAIAAHFGIGEEDLRLLRRWVAESGVRWGLNDNSARELALPVTGRHTWRFGLHRMLLGYAMESHNGEWQGILPYDESSGLAGELAGQLATLLEQLDIWHQELKQPRTLKEWQPVCHHLLAAFFSADPGAEAALALIEEQWEQVVNEGIDAAYSPQIPLTILRDELTARLDQQRISQRFLAGQINFCTLMPMRSIPFKIVCLLGMNDGVYPRTLTPANFDLMQQKPRKGDRSRRDDDRYMFLEALIAAQQQFYLSYIGRAIQDNTERYPSVLISELIEYVSQSFCLPDDRDRNSDDSAERVVNYLQSIQTRMPFSPANFMPQSRNQSFAREWLPAAQGVGEAPKDFVQPLSERPVKSVSFEQLLRFWRHPVRAWFTQRLGVNFISEDSELLDVEPFALGNLERYQLDSELLNTLIKGESASVLFARQYASGNLPWGAFGELLWQERVAEMDQLAQQVIIQKRPVQSLEIDLQLGTIHLYGWLNGVQPDGLLRWRPGELNMNDGLTLWLEHLVWSVYGGCGTSRMIGRKQSQWCFKSLLPEVAMQHLQNLLEGYQSGFNTPLMLLNKSGGAWITACYDHNAGTLFNDEAIRQKAIGRLIQAWQGGYMSEGEGNDPWIQRLCRTLNEEHINAICQAAQQWYLPVLQAHKDCDL